MAVEDSRQGLAAARAAGLPCLVTLSSLSRREPLALFEEACAVVEALAGEKGQVTLSWLDALLPPP
jgi:beta-phosphoglucomutase-like phosphatase (HAD superfamily)